MKHNKEWQFIVILILSCILLFEMVFYLQRNNTVLIFRQYQTTEVDTKDELIIALFMNNIEADSSKFYDNFFGKIGIFKL